MTLKNIFKEYYQPQESFVARNPLFPLEFFLEWNADPEIDAEKSKEILRQSIRKFYLQPIAQEALYVGSPDLHEQLLLWLDNKIEKPDKKEKLELSLAKYMIRMCTRCTPYGLFASCTAGNFSGFTEIILDDKNSLQRYARLDMDYVCELHTLLLEQKEICEQLQFYPNNSLYRIGDQWRYVEHRFQKETGRTYHLVEIDHSEYLEKIICKAKDGSIVSELVKIISDAEIAADEAVAYIYELIDHQVLIDELEPSVSGVDYFSVILNKLNSLQHTENYTVYLHNVKEEFELLKKSDTLSKQIFYKNIVLHLQKLNAPLHVKTLIQVDSYRPATCSLSSKLNEELLKGASLLQLLTSHTSPKESFDDFKTAFINRYEGQWVPLAEVLDTESGIGYGKFAAGGMDESPLIDKLPIGNERAVSNSQLVNTEAFKWELYEQAISQNKTAISIDEKVIEELSKKEFTLAGIPDSISMMVKINARSTEEIDKGNYTITLNSLSGPSGGNLLGRFCHLHPSIERLTCNSLQEEEARRPDCIFAEIVHLPESRIGNILIRPVIRRYEIPYLCRSSLKKKFQIPVSDLLVGIEDSKVRLRSKRLNREVVPRLTTAHNFGMTSLPVYQFLCDLQYQQIRSVGWHWGAMDSRPFLPRISYGKFIVSKARWIITKEELKVVDQKNDEMIVKQFEKFAEAKNLPDHVLLSQGDNELALYLKNIFCLKLLFAEINKSESVILSESLDSPETCFVKSTDGHYTAEFIFAFSKKRALVVKGTVASPKPMVEQNIQRFFPVGSEWLYAKIYCGTKAAEKILTEVILPLTQGLLTEKLIDKFFFVRYHDTGHHIRIRFHNPEKEDFWKEVVSRLREKLEYYVSARVVYNLQFETYQREMERYGFDVMHLSEDIFFHQSMAVLNFISMLDGDEGEQYRWQVALKAVDLLLDAFNYDTEQKRCLIKTLEKNFSNEFNVKSIEQKKISGRFSSHKVSVYAILDDESKENYRLKEAIQIFKIDNQYKNCIEEIINAVSIHGDTGRLSRLLSSYLHMYINRFFVSCQRKNELIIYNYLFRYYDSKLAKEKNKIDESSIIGL